MGETSQHDMPIPLFYMLAKLKCTGTEFTKWTSSLIATCLYAGVNALESLVALQEHRAAVFVNPAAWLPWTSHARLAPP